MDGNRVPFHTITSLLFICLSLSLCLVSAKPLKSSNKTGGYTPQKQQNLRTITVGRNPIHDINEWNNNNHFKHFGNSTKDNPKKDFNSDSDPQPEDPESNEWSLQFDPNYFASLNAANHRPIDVMIASSSDSKTKVSSSSSGSSADNMYYYSPETYGKTTHKNHKTGSFVYSYPSSSSTTSTTTPTPKTSSNRFGEVSGATAAKGFSEPASQGFSTPYNEKDPQNYNYDESNDDEEDTHYYEPNEEVARKYYYPLRNRQKQYSLQDYYGSDLSSMSTSNENSKIKTEISPPTTSFTSHEETHDVGGQNIEYQGGGGGGALGGALGGIGGGGGGGNVRFPSKYYSGGTGAYYPSYYPSPYYGHSSDHSSFSGGESLLKSGWLGPGIAGLLLGILPFGLLMASMVPAFMSVPIVSTATVGRRKRQLSSLDFLSFNNTKVFLNPGVFQIIAKYGMSSLEDNKCLKEMFCTFASEGREDSDTNLAQNILFHVIQWTPDVLAKSLGIDTLFNAIKQNKCQNTYQCMNRKVKFKDSDKYTH